MRRITLLLLLGLVTIGLMTGADSCSAVDEAAVEDAVGEGAPDQTANSGTELRRLMKRVELRMTKGEVLGILGKPNDVQTMDSEGYKSECWYYGDFGDWQLCFDNGLGDEHPLWLTSKNNY